MTMTTMLEILSQSGAVLAKQFVCISLAIKPVRHGLDVYFQLQD